MHQGDVRIVSYLLRHGFDPNASISPNRTLLSWACECQYDRFITMLITFGADTSVLRSTRFDQIMKRYSTIRNPKEYPRIKNSIVQLRRELDEIQQKTRQAHSRMTVTLFGVSGLSIRPIRAVYKAFVTLIGNIRTLVTLVNKSRGKYLEIQHQKLIATDHPELGKAFEEDVGEWESLLEAFGNTEVVNQIRAALTRDEDYVFDPIPEVDDDLESKRNRLVILNSHNNEVQQLLETAITWIRNFHEETIQFFDAEQEHIANYRKSVERLCRSEAVFERIGLSEEIISQLATANSQKDVILRHTMDGLIEQRELIVNIYKFLVKTAYACAS
jgi:hypothetical protein